MSWSLDPATVRDRRVLITGANAGLGYEAARMLATAGAHVLMACRSPQKADEARSRILAYARNAQVDVVTLDLASLASVKAAAEEVGSRWDSIDLLLNNAGLMATDPILTEDGFELQVAVNHLGHFALTAHLLPLLEAAEGSPRVVSHSSMGHRLVRGYPQVQSLEDYDRWNSYFYSKLANLLFTRQLQRRLSARGSKVVATAAHPGGSRTDLGFEGSGLTNSVVRGVFPRFTQTPDRGVLPLLRAATDPTAPPGSFYGPRLMVWGAPVEETPSARAQDADEAHNLWEASIRWTGVEPA
jgi:NAD(P)-dependent dehydrogenase (short-subunit alcohol dehydrogenase family)